MPDNEPYGEFDLLAACERMKARLDATPRRRWYRRWRLRASWLFMTQTLAEGEALAWLRAEMGEGAIECSPSQRRRSMPENNVTDAR